MKEITNALIKETSSLAEVRHRRKLGLFVAEGTKCVSDTLGYFRLQYLFATPAWLEQHPLPDWAEPFVYTGNRGQLGKMSSLSLTPDVIAVYHIPEPAAFDPAELDGNLVVALDRVQDPGNLGTIMRTADWMGVTTLIASTDTVDCYNSKTVQATMGAISRVRVIYGPLAEMLSALKPLMPVYGTFLGGDNIYKADLKASAAVVMGNEGSGISPEIEALVDRRLLIPSYPPERPTSESLNVATATAIVLSQFRSRL